MAFGKQGSDLVCFSGKSNPGVLRGFPAGTGSGLGQTGAKMSPEKGIVPAPVII